MNNYSAVKLPF